MFPTSASVGALLSTLLPMFALLRPARLLALLDRSDLERHRSPAAEDFYPSSPAEGHPPRESDIATRRPGADTVTGLSPVGALPLQAARFGEGQEPTGTAPVLGPTCGAKAEWPSYPTSPRQLLQATASLGVDVKTGCEAGAMFI